MAAAAAGSRHPPEGSPKVEQLDAAVAEGCSNEAGARGVGQLENVALVFLIEVYPCTGHKMPTLGSAGACGRRGMLLYGWRCLLVVAVETDMHCCSCNNLPNPKNDACKGNFAVFNAALRAATAVQLLVPFAA